jgi:flagellar hook-basal body complex protein FliE
MSSSIPSLDMQSMITRMRMLASQMNAENIASQGSKETAFSDSLMQSINKVNELQSVARDKTVRFEEGEDISLTEVMIAKERASIAFEATLQIRNKVLSAYQEIMQMPV